MRDKLLKIVLALVGLGILAANYLLIPSLVDTRHGPLAVGDQMIVGLYQPLAVFLLLAIRNPSASRSLILAFGWSTLAHLAVMVVQSYQRGTLSARAVELLIFAVVGVVFLVLAPRAQASVATTAVPSQ